MKYWELELTIFSDTVQAITGIIIQNSNFLDK